MLKHLRLQRALCFLDVETTGLDPAEDRVVEVAVLRLSPHKDPVSIVRRCNPGIPIPPQATAVHQITDEHVADCPPFRAIAPKLLRALDDADLAGFGVRHFDLPFLVNEFLRSGYNFCLRKRAVVDAQTIFYAREPRDLAAALHLYCRREHDHAHRAEHDVQAAVAVLDAMLGKYSDLPRTPVELHQSMIEVDIAGWFSRQAGEVVFRRGKHRGRLLNQVARADPGYLRWLLNQPVLPDVRRLAGRALEQARE